jgi:hypothetical protein
MPEKPPASVEGDPLRSTKDVRIYLGHISQMSLWRYVKRGRFPGPDFTINRRNFWRHSTVERGVDMLAGRAA